MNIKKLNTSIKYDYVNRSNFNWDDYNFYIHKTFPIEFLEEFKKHFLIYQ